MPYQQHSVYGGRYKVERLLASGSMGDVFVARHLLTGQRVALKVLFPNVARNVGGVERFLNEIRTASSIEHEGVVRIFDAGEDHNTFYYTMELLEGMTLDRWMRAQQRPLVQPLTLIHKVLGTLAEAHSKNIIHRDIKPENIFVLNHDGEQPNVKLLDFGIARDLQATRMTQTGHTLGTPAYMSPEQATAPQNICPASDVWSVGVLLYEVVTGHVPFDAETPQAVCIRSVCDQHVPVSKLVPTTPPKLEAIIDHCLKKSHKARPNHAGALLAPLQEVLDELGPATPQKPAPKPKNEPSPTTTHAYTDPPPTAAPAPRPPNLLMKPAFTLPFIPSPAPAPAATTQLLSPEEVDAWQQEDARPLSGALEAVRRMARSQNQMAAGADPAPGLSTGPVDVLARHKQTFGSWMLREQRPLMLCLELLHRALDDLKRLHQQGLAHLNIHPKNILVLSSSTGQLEIRLRPHDCPQGPFPIPSAYVSPEQTRSPKKAAITADVWSIGVMLYEVVTGQLPFETSFNGAVHKHLPVHQLRPGVHPKLEALIDACLSPDPNERPINAIKLQDALSQLLTAPNPNAAPQQEPSAGEPSIAGPSGDGTMVEQNLDSHAPPIPLAPHTPASTAPAVTPSPSMPPRAEQKTALLATTRPTADNNPVVRAPGPPQFKERLIVIFAVIAAVMAIAALLLNPAVRQNAVTGLEVLGIIDPAPEPPATTP